MNIGSRDRLNQLVAEVLMVPLDMVVRDALANRAAKISCRGGMPSAFQNVCDRRSGDTVSDVLQRTLDARVAPGRILGGHPDH
jgi:hypothetical protein